MTVPQRSFSMADQLRFAALSGDWNPLHVDPIAARRLLFGAPVVHGMHVALWALDLWLDHCPTPSVLQKLHLRFHKPIHPEQTVFWEADALPEGKVRLTVRTDTFKALVMTVTVRGGPCAEERPVLPDQQARGDPRTWTQAALVDACGQTPLSVGPAGNDPLFGRLLERLPVVQLASMLAATRIVGMDLPGRHSVFAEADLEFADPAKAEMAVAYRVIDLERRFGRVQVRMDAGPAANGVLTAFLRPGPQLQQPYEQLKSMVRPGEFAGQQVLVVGGSRGLGEVAAKLLAAGGAGVNLTYASGLEDAARVVDDIRAGGGNAAMHRFNVLDPGSAEALFAALAPTADHLCYFATPSIGSGERSRFDTARFQRFCTFFLDGLLCSLAPWQARQAPLRVLYPSTVFIDPVPAGMTEYAAAKAAAEVLCRRMNGQWPGLHIYAPRLPRMTTDQTVDLQGSHGVAPAPVMLAHLRCLSAPAPDGAGQPESFQQ